MIRVVESLSDEDYLTGRLTQDWFGFDEYFAPNTRLYLASKNPDDFSALLMNVSMFGGGSIIGAPLDSFFLKINDEYYCYIEYGLSDPVTVIGCKVNDAYCYLSIDTIKKLKNITLDIGSDNDVFFMENGKAVALDQRPWFHGSQRPKTGFSFRLKVTTDLQSEFSKITFGRHNFSGDFMCYYDPITEKFEVRNHSFIINSPNRIKMSNEAEYHIVNRLPANYVLLKNFVIVLE